MMFRIILVINRVGLSGKVGDCYLSHIKWFWFELCQLTTMKIRIWDCVMEWNTHEYNITHYNHGIVW